MGSYDTLINEWGDRFQTKALGKCMREIRLGEPVTVRPAPMTHEDFKAWLESGVGLPEQPGSKNCQIRVYAEDDVRPRNQYLTINDGIAVEIRLDRNKTLPLFDYFGVEEEQPVSTPEDPGGAS